MKHEFCVYTRRDVDRDGRFYVVSSVFRRDTMVTWNGQKDQLITPVGDYSKELLPGMGFDIIGSVHDQTVSGLIKLITEG